MELGQQTIIEKTIRDFFIQKQPEIRAGDSDAYQLTLDINDALANAPETPEQIETRVKQERFEEYIETNLQLRIDGAKEWADNMADTLERASKEVREYNKRIGVKENNVKDTDVLSWLVTSISNIFSNLRLDMAVFHATRISEARALSTKKLTQ